MPIYQLFLMFPFGSLYQHSDQLLSPLKIIFYFSQREIRGAVGLPRLAWIRQAWCSTPFFFLVSLLHLPSLYHFQMQCAASSPGCLTHGLQSHTLCASGLSGLPLVSPGQGLSAVLISGFAPAWTLHLTRQMTAGPHL